MNGNLTADNNKAISGITYNHLNLPSVITVTGKGMITYAYDAAGGKQKKVTSETGATVAYNGTSYTSVTITTTTTYLGGSVFENKAYSNATLNTALGYTDQLQFMAHEEGRIRFKPVSGAIPASFQYDYMLKDHLGNVRMVLTEEQQTIYYPAATVEGTYSATGTTQVNSMINYEKQFYTIDNTKVVTEASIPSWPTETVANTKLYYNHNDIPPASPNPNYPSGVSPVQTAGSDKLYKLNATTNKTGLEFIIKVMAGDKIDILGKSYFLNTGTVNNANSTLLDLAGLMTNLIGAPANAIAAKGVTAAQLNTWNTGLVPSSFFRGTNGETTTIPKAYINYIFLDEQFKYAGGDFSRVGSSGTVKNHWNVDVSQLQNITVPENGYIFVYVNNESNLDVFFDNLQVVHKPGPILEETHYYPFGLTMSGISSKAANIAPNRIGITSKEMQNKEFTDGTGIEQYDFGARFYDPQLGRWHTMDPLAEEFQSLSSYVYVANNPSNCIDPNGKEWVQVNGHIYWDDRVTDAESASRFYGEGAVHKAIGYEFDNKSQGHVVLGEKGQFTADGNSLTALDASPNAVGDAIMKGGFETFMFYFEKLGSDYFFTAANTGFNDNSSGFMAFLKSNKENGIEDALRLSQMTHSWVDRGNGWTPEKNRVEHQIGMFLMAEKYGPDRAQRIGALNEWRGLLINDRQSGNIINAILGRGNTAFQWVDLIHNAEGLQKWREYNSLKNANKNWYQKIKEIPDDLWH